MDIHEYQAKEILAGFGVRIPVGGLAYSPEQAAYRAREIGGDKWAVKAQVHTGGRGKAGGIKLCANEYEVFDAANGLFGKRLVTNQTGPDGKIVYRVYVEGATSIERELYLGFVLDRSSEKIMVVASAEGGMDIEEIAETRPDSMIRTTIEPAVGIRDFQAREIAFGLGIDKAHRACDNAIVLPHQSEAPLQARETAGLRMVDNVLDFFEGRSPRDRV